MKDLFCLKGKRALITGGSTGIGFACACGLADYGAQIAVLDYNETLLDSGLKEMRTLGIEALGLKADLRKSAEVYTAVEQMTEHMGGVDILIHAASAPSREHVMAMQENDWCRVMDTNINGSFYIGRAVGEQMIRQNQGGKMVFFATTGAFRTTLGGAPNSTSKSAVIMLMKSFALELAPYQICVNAIAPTVTETMRTKPGFDLNPERKVQAAASHPLGRIAQPTDFIGPAIYLSSRASDFVTGTTLIVDGGKTIS